MSEGAAFVALAVRFLPFAIATSISPGVNSAMLTMSGATFGFRATIPHMLGIVVGFPLMALTVGLGAAELLQAAPGLQRAMRVGGLLFILYLAWRMSLPEHRVDSATSTARPLTAVQAALLQWANPKAWMMVGGAFGAYLSPGLDLHAQIYLVTAIFALIAVPSTIVWTAFGTWIGRVLKTRPGTLLAFNRVMAMLLIATAATLI